MHSGIALATSISTFFGCVIYFVYIVKENKLRAGNFFKNQEGFKYLIRYTIEILILSFLMVVSLKIFTYFLNYANLEWNIFYMVIFILLGLIIYFICAFVFKRIPTEIFKKSI